MVNSRFIACTQPVASVEEARAYIQRIKKDYPAATHHVPAFIIGPGSSVITHCSDGGEPSGTAGRPILDVLSGSGLGDIIVVVVRYFGGTKLGTGGLVKAYTEAPRSVLAALPRAVKVSTTKVMLELAYAQMAGVRRLVTEYGGRILDEDFQANIWMTARFISACVNDIQIALRNFSRGTVQAEVLEVIPNSILPVSPAVDESIVSPENGGDRKK